MLNKQTITIPLAVGLDQKTDSKQVPSTGALALSNVRFYKTGKLQKRFGLVLLTNVAFNGVPTTLSSKTIQNVVADGEQINALTNDGIYSKTDETWFKSSRYNDGVSVQTEFINKNATNQVGPDCDISPDGKYMAFIAGQYSVISKSIMLTIEDQVTGLRKVTSFDVVTAGVGFFLQRVVATQSGGLYYFHVFYQQYDGATFQLYRRCYDENLQITTGPTIITTLPVTAQFDVCKNSSNIFVVKIATTTASLFKLDLTGSTVLTSTSTVTSIFSSASRAGGMSIVTTASNLHVSWIVSGGAAVKGFDLNLNATITEQVQALSAARKVGICPTPIGLFLAFSTDEEQANQQIAFYNLSFTTTYFASALASPRRFLLVGQPFYMAPNTYCPVNIKEDCNNGYLLNVEQEYASLIFSPAQVARPALPIGEYLTMTSKAVSTSSGVFALAIPKQFKGVTGNTSGTTADFVATFALAKSVFNTNITYKDGSRQKIGESILVTRGSIIELDDRAPHENGFMVPPHLTSVTVNTGTPDPSVASKVFNYLATYEFSDGNGQITRSSPSLALANASNANAASIQIIIKTPPFSLKNILGSSGTSSAPIVVLYRTEATGSVFYRLREIPVVDNTGLAVVVNDNLPDAQLIDNEILYTAGNVLPNDPAPSSRFSTSGGNRMFVGGLEEKDEIAYSKQQLFGESVAFSDFFRIRISSGTSADKSDLAAIGYMDGKIIPFRENTIYYCQGDGPNETGTGSFTEPEVISSDVGCTDPRSVLNTPNGIMFKSRKGIYLLDRSLSTSYVGSGVEEYNSQNILSAYVSNKYNEARFLTSAGNLLVYNFLFGQWSVFAGQSTVDADIWANNPVSIMSNRIVQETENTYLDQTAPYSMTFGTPWYKLSGLEDFGRIWSLEILGTFKSSHTLRVSVYVDYNDTAVQTRDIVPLVTDKQYQYRIHLKQQKCEAMRFVIQDISPTGESMDLSALAMEVGLKSGTFKLNAARKY